MSQVESTIKNPFDISKVENNEFEVMPIEIIEKQDMEIETSRGKGYSLKSATVYCFKNEILCELRGMNNGERAEKKF